MAVGEVEVCLVEYGCPLEGCACSKLAKSPWSANVNSMASASEEAYGQKPLGWCARVGNMNIPCNRWHVKQWQYFASSGFSLLS